MNSCLCYRYAHLQCRNVYFCTAGALVSLGTRHAPLLLHCIRIAPFPAGTSEARSTPVIPSSGVPVSARMRPTDAYFELIADTLDGLESSARAQFLQRFLLSLAHVEIPESKTIALWDEILTRRIQLSERADSPVALHTALVDVLSSSGMFNVPVVLEYDELKNLHRNAVTDPLTGLYNRRLFNENFDKELNRARRYAHPLSLVTLDLHRFKEVNDKHGHPRGDDVLRAAAATLKKALRTSDSAFRIGGDEFALLLPQTDSPQALALCRRVQTVFIEMLQPLQLAVTVGMDHGVAIFPQDAEHADQLIRIADERLYDLKHENHRKSGNGSARTEAPPALAPEEPQAPTPERAAPQPISIETKRATEKTETTIAAAASATSAAISGELTAAL